MSGVKGMKRKVTKENKAAVFNFGIECIENLQKNIHKYDEKKQFQIWMAFGLKAMPSQVNQEINNTVNVKEQESDIIAQKTREAIKAYQSMIQ